MLNYSRTLQTDGKRYDQLLGGDGNLMADLRDLSLDFFYAKYQRIGFGWFDQVTASYSYNSQHEERVNQGGNGNPNDLDHARARADERARLPGAGHQAVRRRETTCSSAASTTPSACTRRRPPSTRSTPVTTVRRGRVPDNASYRSGAGYVQDVFDADPRTGCRCC